MFFIGCCLEKFWPGKNLLQVCTTTEKNLRCNRLLFFSKIKIIIIIIIIIDIGIQWLWPFYLNVEKNYFHRWQSIWAKNGKFFFLPGKFAFVYLDNNNTTPWWLWTKIDKFSIKDNFEEEWTIIIIIIFPIFYYNSKS